MSLKQMFKLLSTRNSITANILKYKDNKIQASSNYIRSYSKSNDDFEADLNKPLKYTTSPANDWKAQHSRIGTKDEFGPWYQPHSVSISLIIFMIYFFILREENDIDLMLDQPLTNVLKEN